MNTPNKDIKKAISADAQVAFGLLAFLMFAFLIVLINYQRNMSTQNEKHRKQIGYLQHEISVLKDTFRADIIDREGQLPYNQVAGHMKSLGL
jgi:cell division protein FtsI/penicillin-binding protein 2